MCCQIDDWMYTAPSSGHFRQRPPPPLAKTQTAGEIVSFFILRPVYVFFYCKIKKIQIWFFFIIFNYIYFEAIQAAVFCRQNASKMFKSSLFMFLDLLVSCDKDWSLGKIDYWKVSSKIRDNESLSPQKPPKIVTISCFWYFLETFFWWSYEAILEQFFEDFETILFKQFCLNLNFCFLL